MTRYIVAIAIVSSLWAAPALNAAVECKAAMPPAAKEYWSWRLIDGKRCWYPGRPGMDKANLRWPQSGQAREDVDVDRTGELRNHYSQPKMDVPTVTLPEQTELSFDERWPY